MKFKKEGDKLYGKLDYESITDTGLKISIGSIFSLTETGIYFDWGLEKCGFGQYSLNYDVEKKQWTIMNECMGPESSYSIIKALEEAIIASGDQKAIYCLNRMISLISYYSTSLAKSVLLIWNNTNKEGGDISTFEKTLNEHKKSIKSELKTEKNMLCSNDLISVGDVSLYSIATNHYSYNNKNGAFYEASVDLFFDIKHLKHGFLYMTQRIDLNSGVIVWSVTENMDVKTLGKIIKVLENVEGEYEKIWNVWKNAVKITGGPVKMATNILAESTVKYTRYPTK